jgi:hypothetical protein
VKEEHEIQTQAKHYFTKNSETETQVIQWQFLVEESQ